MEKTYYDIASEVLGIPKLPETGLYPFEILDTFNDELILVHYDEEYVKTTSLDDPLRLVRGTIIDINTRLIVCSSYGYIPRIVTDNSNFINERSEYYLDTDGQSHAVNNFFSINDALGYYRTTGVKSFNIMPLYEGTTVRLWKYKKKRLISTHRKINADKSIFGSSKTFSQILNECLEGYKVDNVLDDNLVMNFTLMNRELLRASKFPISVYGDNRDGIAVFMGNTMAANDIPFNNVALQWWFGGYLLDAFNYYNFSNNPSKKLFITWLLEERYIDEMFKSGYNLLGIKDSGTFNSYGEGIVLQYAYSGKNRLIQVVPSNYQFRDNIFGDNPNTLNYVFYLLTVAQYPNNINKKITPDNYIENLPPVNNIFLGVSEKDFERRFVKNEPFIDVSMYPSYSVEELTDSSNPNSQKYRFNNAVMHYAMSLPLYKQLDALYFMYKMPSYIKALKEAIFITAYNLVNRTYIDSVVKRPYVTKTIEFLSERIEAAAHKSKVKKGERGGLNLGKFKVNEKEFKVRLENTVDSFTGDLLYKLCNIYGVFKGTKWYYVEAK